MATTNLNGILIPVESTNPARMIQAADFDEMVSHLGVDMVQVHYSDDTLTFWSDEEGLLKASPQINYAATALIQSIAGFFHPVVGHVFITGGVDEEGNSMPLGDMEATELLQKLPYDVQSILERARQVNKNFKAMQTR